MGGKSIHRLMIRFISTVRYDAVHYHHYYYLNIAYTLRYFSFSLFTVLIYTSTKHCNDARLGKAHFLLIATTPSGCVLQVDRYIKEY